MHPRNIHPADELALIRSDIRRLRDREAFLRKGFLSLALPTRGEDAVATVKILKERKLRRDLLPASVLENEAYWETTVIRHVQVDEVRSPAGMAAFMPPHVSDVADVIEPF